MCQRREASPADPGFTSRDGGMVRCERIPAAVLPVAGILQNGHAAQSNAYPPRFAAR